MAPPPAPRVIQHAMNALLRRGLLFCALWGMALLPGSPAIATEPARQAAQKTLWSLFREEKGWTKIHAAEALAENGFCGEVRRACAPFSDAPEKAGFPKIGYWRVMARCAEPPGGSARWVALLEEKAQNPETPEWTLAVEALAKLSVRPGEALAARLRRQARRAKPADALFAWWLLGGWTDAEARAALLAALESPDAGCRLRAAFILGQQKPGDAEIAARLEQAAQAEPAVSPPFPYLAAAAGQWEPAGAPAWRARLEEALFSGPPATALAAARGLLRLPGAPSRERLVPLLRAPAPSTRIAAALLLLGER